MQQIFIVKNGNYLQIMTIFCTKIWLGSGDSKALELSALDRTTIESL